MLLALGLLSLAGCNTVASTPSSGASRISFRISFMVFGDPAELRAYQTLVDSFEQKYPAVDVELIHVPGQSDYQKRLAADFAAGTPANIVLLNYRRYAVFATQGTLEPIGPYLAQSNLIREEDFYTEALAPFHWRGTLICLPQNISSLVVYYNKNLFDDAGLAYPDANWTRDDFLAAASALTRDTDGDGVTDQYGVGVEPTLMRLAPFVWQNGGDLVDNLITPQRLMLDEPKARAAVQWFVDLQVTHHIAPDAVAEAAEGSESRFINGRLGMYLNSRRATPALRTVTAFDWDVAPLPGYKGRETTVLHSDGYCLTAATSNKAAAWQFIEYANAPEGQTIVAATGRTVPSLKAVAESPAFLDPGAKPANSRVFIDAIPHLRAVPVLKNWVDIETIAGDELERAFYGQATVDEAIRAAIRRTDEYFKK